LIRPLEIKREALDDFAEEELIQLDLDPKRRPLLYRMAEDKKHHLERNSMAGSEYFMVQLPDGTMERRQKMPLNVDPGVHSTFHLDQFTSSHTPAPPLTPVHPLSTITEAEKQGSESDGSTAAIGSGDIETVGEVRGQLILLEDFETVGEVRGQLILLEGNEETSKGIDM
jgi:hypothetical protein